MASALVPLANVTLGSSASSVSFSSITGIYRDLIIVTTAFNTAAGFADIWARYNGDSGTNYTRVYMFGNGSSTGSGTNSDTVNYLGYSSNVNDNIHTTHIFDYSATDKHKVNLVRANSASNSAGLYAGRWASTAAITSITFGTNGTSFAAGSTFMLYGVSA